MKKSKFSEEQITFVLYQADTGTNVDEVCRKMGRLIKKLNGTICLNEILKIKASLVKKSEEMLLKI